MTSDIVPSNCPLGVKQLGTNKMIRLLVDFLTLEASSLGPSAVSSIRVVEIRPAADSQLQKGQSVIKGNVGLYLHNSPFFYLCMCL